MTLEFLRTGGVAGTDDDLLLEHGTTWDPAVALAVGKASPESRREAAYLDA